MATAGLGLAFHLFIAFAVAAVFYAALRTIPVLRQRSLLAGLTHGVLVYFVMSDVVLPLSAVPKTPFSLPLFLNGALGHALFVGLPIALLARRSLPAHAAR